MKIIKNTLRFISAILTGFLIFGQNAFAAPPAPTVSPSTITSGGTVNVTMMCTVAGNVIDAVYLNPTGGAQTEVSSFTDHTCTASDVTTGYTAPIVVTLLGSSNTVRITFNESGSTAGGSPGISPASNSITVNPVASALATIETTGSTVALDGSDPITNNMWLKHTYTIKNIGSVNLVIGDDPGEYVLFGSGHWSDNKSSIISNGGLNNCTLEDFHYRCTDFTIAPGQSVTFSFKSYFQECLAESVSVGTTLQETDLRLSINTSDINISDSKENDTHGFSYKYIGCDYNVNSAGSSSGSSTSTTKVPKTGYSPLVTSLMIISAGAVLASGSVIAFNKFKK